MKKAIQNIYRNNLATRPGERILVVTDQGQQPLAEQFLAQARDMGHEAEMVAMPVADVHGVEPPARVADEMLAADVVLIITTKSLSHTKARARATQNGARIATMPGVTRDMLKRFAQVDLGRMKARTNRLADALDQGHRVVLTSAKGTHLTFSISDRMAHGRKASVFDQPGYWGNIPCGEACVAPVEDSVDGTLVIDASIAGIGLVDCDTVFQIEGGQVAEIRGGTAARQFEALLDHHAKRQVAEFGIGTNDKAAITGITLEDEKALGTCHIAFGNNSFFGGTNRVSFHIDCVMKAPNIEIDGVVLSPVP